MKEDYLLNKFLEEMKHVLESHREKKGDSWKEVSIPFLENKLNKEVKEYFYERLPKAKHELIDIANICFMLWTRFD